MFTRYEPARGPAAPHALHRPKLCPACGADPWSANFETTNCSECRPSRRPSHRHSTRSRRAWGAVLFAGWVVALWGWADLIVGSGSPCAALGALLGGSCLSLAALIQRAPYLRTRD